MRTRAAWLLLALTICSQAAPAAQPAELSRVSAIPGQVEAQASPVVEVRAIEVNQVVQDWLNTVPLIAGKPTLVRVFLQAPAEAADDLPQIQGQLRAFRDGTELSLSPQMGFAGEGEDGLHVPRDATTRRNDLSGSLNFYLPDEWTRGAVTLKFEATNAAAVFAEPAEPNGAPHDGLLNLEFVPTPDLPIRFHLATEIADDGTRFAPSRDQLLTAIRRVTSLFPVERLRWKLGFTPIIRSKDIPDAIDYDKVYNQLRAASEYLACPGLEGCELHQAILPFIPSQRPGSGGLAESHATLVSVARLPAGELGAEAIPHQIAHCLGRQHPYPSSASLVPGGLGPDYFPGVCGEKTHDPDPFPDFEDVPPEGLRPVLGPLSLGEDMKVYGAGMTDPHRPQIKDPLTYFELMSHCHEGNAGWISKHTYLRLKEEIERRYSEAPPAGLLAAGPPSSHLIVRGTIDLSNSSVSFLPLRRILTGTTLLMDTPGPFSLELIGGTDNVLREYSFEPDINSEVGAKAGFYFVVPDPSEFRRLRLKRNSATIFTAEASAHRPTIELLSPNGGEMIAADSLTIRWAASDPDGDSLRYFVEFSADGGTSWEALAVDWTDTELVVPKNTLPGGSDLRVRVEATDGFWSAFDSSNAAFRVTDNPPEVFLLSPQDETTVTYGSLVRLEATTLDSEDGNLPDAKVSWASDLNGPLGTGLKIDRAVSDLKPGEHRITVTATDSAGNTATATVALHVARNTPPRLADLRMTSPNGLEFKLFSSLGTTNVIETSTDLMQWRPALTNTSSASPATLTVNRTSGESLLFLRAVQR